MHRTSAWLALVAALPAHAGGRQEAGEEVAPLAIPASGAPSAGVSVLPVAPVFVDEGSAILLRVHPGDQAVEVCPPRAEGEPAWDRARTSLDVGPAFVSVQCVTEGGSFERVAFATLDGRLVDLSAVEREREARFPYPRCVWGRPVGSRLLLWDYDRAGAPYSCADDGKVEDGFTIPRHYELDPATGACTVVPHDPPCAALLALGDEPTCVPATAPPPE